MPPAIDAATASIPIQKWSMKATSRNTGVHGRSKIAAIAGVLIVDRTVSKSRIAWPAAPFTRSWNTRKPPLVIGSPSENATSTGVGDAASTAHAARLASLAGSSGR